MRSNVDGIAPDSHIAEWPEKWVFGGIENVLLYVDNSIPTTWPQREAAMKRHKAEIAAAGEPGPGEIGFPLPPGARYSKDDTLRLVSHYFHQLQGKTYAYHACAPRRLYSAYYRGFSTAAMAARRRIHVQENFPDKAAGCPAGRWPVRLLVYVAQDAPRPATLRPTDWPHDFLDVYRRAETAPPTAEQLGVPIFPGSKALALATAELAMERRVDNTERTGFAAVYLACDVDLDAANDFYKASFLGLGVGRVNNWETYDSGRHCASTTRDREAWAGYAILASPTAEAR